MGEVKGIQESKEALIGMMEVSLVLAHVLKDGAQLGDIAAVWARIASDKDLREKMKKALDDIGQVPSEIADLDLQEGLDLAMLLGSYAPKFLDIFRRP